MRTEPVLAGVYDPLRRIAPETVETRLRAGLARFGDVVVHHADGLIVGAAYPTGVQPSATTAPLCVATGYLESGAGPLETELAAAWRRDALADLRGAFAAVLWDPARRVGVLVRDHLAQRPLFTLESGPVLSFASEVRPLLALQATRPEPDPVAIALYLAPGAVRPPGLPYTGVKRVPGGHVVRLGGERWTVEPFWRPRYEPPLAGSPDELAVLTRQRIAEAVNRTTDGADRAGVLLSGGLDSTSVTAVATGEQRRRGGDLRAYSLVFPDYPTGDETEQITMVTEQLGIGLTSLAVAGGSSLGSSLEYLDLFEVPELSATGFFWRPLARRAAADGMRVLLSGEGGDEVFAAPLYLIADRIRRGRLRSALALVERFPNIAYNPWRSLRLRLLWKYGVLPSLPAPVSHRLAAAQDRRDAPDYISASTRALLAGLRPAAPPARSHGPLWWERKLEHFTQRVWEIGAPEQTTRAARLAGVTERHPLLTVDLILHALRLPPEHGFDPERTRPDLRRAMAGLLPDPVRLRPDKVDFDAIRGYSLQADRDVIRELIGGPDARIRPYVDPEVVERMLRAVPERWGELSAWGGGLMRLVTVESFLRHQEDPGFAAELRESGRLAAPRMEFRS